MGESVSELDQRHVWHPFTQQQGWMDEPPVVIERGEGTDLIDADGNRYIDGVSSLWCNVHGHRHEAIDAAVRDQLDRIAHSTMLGLTHPGAAELAAELVEVAPPGLSRVFYSESGSTAVEIALKMAFQYWHQAAASSGGPPSSASPTATTATRSAPSRSAASTSSTAFTSRCCSSRARSTRATRHSCAARSSCTHGRSLP